LDGAQELRGLLLVLSQPSGDTVYRKLSKHTGERRFIMPN
jgi:hypothetical protein